MFKNSPEEFIANHGIYFVDNVVYGGSYFGFWNIWEKDQSGEQALDVFRNFENPQDIFTKQAMSDFFLRKLDNHTDKVNADYNLAYRGGPALDPVASPIEMGNQFSSWWS